MIVRTISVIHRILTILMRNQCNKSCLISYNVFYGLNSLGNYILLTNNMQHDDVVNIKSGRHAWNNIWFYQKLTFMP